MPLEIKLCKALQGQSHHLKVKRHLPLVRFDPQKHAKINLSLYEKVNSLISITSKASYLAPSYQRLEKPLFSYWR
ncbi:hypothetical protein DDZ16_13460 [Marinilabilia rubra]|uniref:Uncharacterized protein n=1 Tax=Marinilabilia rubra TaxID=2162893 RepID=A0A2U2B6S3_9BACT|nr:hypothetical protein DDZ16_13460 [Marinilabilia rubra]